ncbi:Proclotting enzyme [Halotydeus destructor]|nr:Proclotting enzyme [Halotydeus destructor]
MRAIALTCLLVAVAVTMANLAQAHFTRKNIVYYKNSLSRNHEANSGSAEDQDDRQGGHMGVGNSPDQQSGCATAEGRSGTCTAEVMCANKPANKNQTVYCESSTPTSNPLICCPSTSAPGVYPPTVAGCGQKGNAQAIVGGQEAEPLEWPWQVALFQRGSGRNPTEANFICGGSIIHKRFIMTAAHCVVRMEGRINAEDFLVLVGARNIKTEGTFVNVSKVIAHENYRATKKNNDITLFRLTEELEFNSPAIRPVCLPTAEMDKNEYVGEMTTVTGWGTTSFGGNLSQILMEVEVPVVGTEECNAAYKSEMPSGGEINHSNICSGYDEGGKDSCQGDSGGPLVWESVDEKKWYEFGIVSYGYKCAEPKYPGVYTRVSAFLKWIGSHMEENMAAPASGGFLNILS